MASPIKRPPPPGFDQIFVERGRLECEEEFNARRTTVTRWLAERGTTRLIAERAAFVKSNRPGGGSGLST